MFVFWEIVGITPAALAHLIAKDFVDAKGIQRCHDMSRRERGKQLFNRDAPMMNSYEFFYKHDKTILALKAENDHDNFDRKTFIPISHDVFGKVTYGVVMSRRIRQYLAKVHAPRTVPDGVALDVAGNLYISLYNPNIIYRLSPAGELLTLVDDWQQLHLVAPTNIAFGGADMKTLIIASLCGWSVHTAVVPIAGLRLRYPDLGARA